MFRRVLKLRVNLNYIRSIWKYCWSSKYWF